MEKIDAHLHLVGDLASYKGIGRSNALGNGEVIWDDGFRTRLFPVGWGEDSFKLAKALEVMKQNDVSKAVLLQGNLYGFQNYYSWQAAKKHPDRFIAAFSVDPYADGAMKIVERHVRDLGFRTMKLEISQGGGLMGYHEEFRLDADPRWEEIFEYIARYPGFVVAIDYGDASQKSHQPEAVAHLAQRYPQLDFVVCHLSFPKPGKLDELASELRLLSRFDNVACDLAALQDIAQETNYPYPFCQEAVRLGKDILGSQRLVWGSDAPWSATFNRYDQLASWLEDAEIFPEKDLHAVMYGNAERIYFKPDNVKAMRESADPLVD